MQWISANNTFAVENFLYTLINSQLQTEEEEEEENVEAEEEEKRPFKKDREQEKNLRQLNGSGHRLKLLTLRNKYLYLRSLLTLLSYLMYLSKPNLKVQTVV